jgi:hypothetical protein
MFTKKQREELGVMAACFQPFPECETQKLFCDGVEKLEKGIEPTRAEMIQVKSEIVNELDKCEGGYDGNVPMLTRMLKTCQFWLNCHWVSMR